MDETWTSVEVVWKGSMTFQGKNKKNSTVTLGAAASPEGISPMELLLIGLAGCSGMDIVSILVKKEANLDAFQVYTRGSRAKEHPRVYEEIEITYLLWGKNLASQDIEQAIRLSEEKYCSASAMLGKTAKITSSYKINPNLHELPGEQEIPG